MMTNNIKMMNDMELDMVAGGSIQIYQELADYVRDENTSSEGSFSEAVSTAWEVVKYAFELCG